MLRGVPARLFGSGLPATGEGAELAVGEREIEVRTAEQTHRAPLDALRVREIGTGRPGLELAWDGAQGLRAVQVTSPQAVRALRAWAPFAQAPAVRALHSRQQRRALGRTLGLCAMALFLLSPLLLLGLFLSQADRIAQAAAQYVPAEQEARLGEHAFEQLRADLQLEESGPAHAAVQELGERLSRGSRYRYRFHVVRSDELNAFALPGGIIAVHSGLIEATSRPEELAGVLAHEIQHVELRHSLQAAVKQLGLRGLWLLATGELGSSALGQAALELTALAFSRDAEAQADAAGFDTLIERGIDPSGMADFFAALAGRGGTATPAFLSTHPASAQREQALRERSAALGERRFEPLPAPAWPPR